MDDLKDQINQILSDPQSMQQLQSMASALGLGNTQEAPPQQTTGPSAAVSPAPNAGGIDTSALAGMLSTLGNAAPPAPAPAIPALGGVTPEMLQTIGRLAPLLSQVNREDDSTRLLQALRPLLSDKRQKKLDEAVKILQMMRLMPLLKDSGLFSGLLSGLL